MNHAIRFTRPCRAELIRLTGALAQQDGQMAAEAIRLLGQHLEKLQQDISECHKLDEQYPSIHEARLDLGSLAVCVAFDVETDGKLTMLALRL